MRTVWNFSTAGQIHFGTGAIEQLGEVARRRNLRRILLVSDRVLESVGIIERAMRPLREAGIAVEVFNGGEPEPSISAVIAACEQARKSNPDGILAVGGGSNMDIAKMAAVLYTHGGRPSDYFGFDKVPGPIVPLICAPTTAGTGSEVSHAAVATDTDNGVKVSTLSSFLRPAVAVVDPELTYGCPAKVTADSGIDALTHAIEAMTASDFDKLPVNEPCGYEGRYLLGICIAEEAIKLIGRHLVNAVREPGNQAARNGMSLGATMAGIAFSNCGVALVHALEYPIGAALHCSHGAGNGLLLPFVMEYNLPERKSSFARIAQLLGADTSTLNEDAAAQKAIELTRGLCRAIGIPETIRSLGGRREQLPLLAEKSYAIKRLMTINPRRPSQDDLLGILEAAF